MKKAAIISSAVVIVVLAALPVLAKGPGGGQGYGMGPGQRGFGPGAVQGMSEEKAQALQEARQKFFTETQDLRNQIQLKRAELRALFLNPETKEADLLAKNKELQTFRNQMSEKRLVHRIEMKKQFPELGAGFGRGFGMGPDNDWHHGRGRGQARGAGFGGGYCWQ